VITPRGTIGFVGLGNMGLPMAGRVAQAGFVVKGYDVSPEARAALGESSSATVVSAPGDVACDADAVILMLPSSAIVEHVLLADGLLDAMRPGSVVIDMSSSQPLSTRALAAEAQSRGVDLVDAPVSGGVIGARDGTLTIMFGGTVAAANACASLLSSIGSRVVHVGAVGAGHAVKALNNLLSATSLLATSEAVAIGRTFGVDPATLIDAINGSSGRSGATEQKFPRFILTETYDSGFTATLMVKDLHVALGLGEQLGISTPLSAESTRLWDDALADMPTNADHTQIAHWVDRRDHALRANRTSKGPAESGGLQDD
jgi:3-hydroxyisobutyrate dehydrogenase